MSYKFEMGQSSLKILIGATAALSLLAAFIPFLYSLLSLSLNGILHLYLWQPISYLFVLPGPISFPFFLHLAFNLYLLWTFGSFFLARSPSLFFSLYFGAGIFAALLALGTMFLFHLPYSLSGSSPALYAILIAWVILNPDATLLLFFALPFKARWLLLGLIGANLLIDLSHADWISFSSYLGATLFGYFFSLLAWREQSPFPYLRPFERFLFRTLERLRQKKPLHRSPKVYDIHSGSPRLDDDQFMDAMLARISLHGEDSLTPEEKTRMQKISARKSAGKK